MVQHIKRYLLLSLMTWENNNLHKLFAGLYKYTTTGICLHMYKQTTISNILIFFLDWEANLGLDVFSVLSSPFSAECICTFFVAILCSHHIAQACF